jgi:hypothetical protein
VFDGSRLTPPVVGGAGELEGEILGRRWAGMGDWCEFAMIGMETEWLPTWGDTRRYVPGLRVRVSFANDGTNGRVGSVARVWIEDSNRRSSAFGPGPGKAQWRSMHLEGTAVYWAVFGSRTQLHHAIATLAAEGAKARAWNEPGSPVLLLRADGDVDRIHPLVEALGGRFDGLERPLSPDSEPHVGGPGELP